MTCFEFCSGAHEHSSIQGPPSLRSSTSLVRRPSHTAPDGGLTRTPPRTMVALTAAVELHAGGPTMSAYGQTPAEPIAPSVHLGMRHARR